MVYSFLYNCANCFVFLWRRKIVEKHVDISGVGHILTHMNTKYAISHYGAGIAVGLLQEDGAQEDINLAHNLYDSTCHESIFHGTILFNSIKQFRRFLAFKVYHQLRVPFEKEEFSVWKEAFREARRVLREQCVANNFMIQMVAANTSKHNIGSYQDETDYEC